MVYGSPRAAAGAAVDRLPTVTVLSAVASLVATKAKWSWFMWHPIAMILGFVGCATAAVLHKRVGGYKNTKTHGYLMSAATVLGGAGW